MKHAIPFHLLLLATCEINFNELKENSSILILRSSRLKEIYNYKMKENRSTSDTCRIKNKVPDLNFDHNIRKPSKNLLLKSIISDSEGYIHVKVPIINYLKFVIIRSDYIGNKTNRSSKR